MSPGPESQGVLTSIREARRRSPIHLTVIDPDEQSPEQAGRIAQAAVAAGSFAIVVGGSTAVDTDEVDRTVRAVKERAAAPVILLPAGAPALSPAADAIWWMSLLNSRSPRYLIREQARAAPYLARTSVEPIPMAYLVIEPGMRVGEVGEADLIARDDPQSAVAYAMAGQYFGMQVVFLEAGSGAPEPVPVSMVSAVREATSMLLLVSGGIRGVAEAARIVEAGADMIATGTLVEQADDVEAALRPIIEAIS